MKCHGAGSPQGKGGGGMGGALGWGCIGVGVQGVHWGGGALGWGCMGGGGVAGLEPDSL